MYCLLKFSPTGFFWKKGDRGSDRNRLLLAEIHQDRITPDEQNND